MLDMENNDNPYEEKRNAIALWKEIADEYCSSAGEILSAGQGIMKLGIKPKDSLHIACAMKSGCKYFITTDAGLINKKVSGIKIINPIDFVREAEDLL
jgi:predicted nucleic acid-binding protein